MMRWDDRGGDGVTVEVVHRIGRGWGEELPACLREIDPGVACLFQGRLGERPILSKSNTLC